MHRGTSLVQIRMIAPLTIALGVLCCFISTHAQVQTGSHVSTSGYAADSAATCYNHGNDSYRRGDFVEATEWYQRALDLGARNSAVYYNLANAWFRLGRTGQSILNYERAVRLNPANEDARNNLEFASLLVVDRVTDENAEFKLVSTLRDAVGRIRANILALGFASGFIGVCFVSAWWVYGGRKSRKTVLAMIVAGFLLVTSLGVVGIQRIVDDTGTAAIVLSAEAEARFEPGPHAKVAFVLHEGTKVWIERVEDSWTLIELPSGMRGWIPSRVIEVI